MQELLWGILGFVFYKIVYDVSFHHNLTITASVLLALLSVGLVNLSSMVYANQFTIAKMNAAKNRNWFVIFARAAFMITIVSVVINIAVSRLIIFGFSKRLNGEIEFYKTYDGLEDFYIMLAICAFVPVMHYFSVLFLADKSAKKDLDFTKEYYDSIESTETKKDGAHKDVEKADKIAIGLIILFAFLYAVN